MAVFHVTPLIFIGALVLGSGIGVLTGLFGVGGGFLVTPLLNILLGVPMSIAVGTGSLLTLGTSTAGLYRRHKEHLVDYKLAIVMFGGNLVGVRLGDSLLQSLKGLGEIAIGGTFLDAVDIIPKFVFIVLLAAITGWILYDTLHNTAQEDAPVTGIFGKIRIPPYTNFETLDHPRMSIAAISYFGVLVGFLTGLLGIGGGVIMMPALLYLVGMRPHRSSATSLAIVFLSSLVAVISKVPQGDTSIPLAIPLLLGGTFGLQFGVSICNKTSGSNLKKYFVGVVVAAMVVVIYNVISLVF